MHPFRKTAFLLIIGVLVLWQPGWTSAHQVSQPSAYEKAKSCQAELLKSSRNMKYRHRWERCISLYHGFIKASPQHPLTEEALFRLTELYLGLWKFSGNSLDVQKAQETAEELKRRNPTGLWTANAEAKLRQNQGTSHPVSKQSSLAALENVRFWSHPDYTRVVFDLSRPVHYTQQKEKNPERLFIDLQETRLGKTFGQEPLTIQDGILKQVKVIQLDTRTVRATLDLGQVTDHRIIHFTDPDRVVVDIFGLQTDRSSPIPYSRSARQITTIVIDPGHGGKDPGAVGPNGLTEKDVVLDVGLRLKDLIGKNLGHQVLMTRHQDTFIPLEERTQFANEKRADLFISIHANASPNRHVRGIELYTLGQATDSTALATAARENSLQEESLKNLDRVIQLMLTDLSIMKRLDESLLFADITRQAFLKTLGTSYDVVDLGVKQAPFYVLMNAGMPSLLAEISFISNPVESKRLANSRYRAKIAQSLFEGVREFIQNHTRPQSLKAAK